MTLRLCVTSLNHNNQPLLKYKEFEKEDNSLEEIENKTEFKKLNTINNVITQIRVVPRNSRSSIKKPIGPVTELGNYNIRLKTFYNSRGVRGEYDRIFSDKYTKNKKAKKMMKNTLLMTLNNGLRSISYSSQTPNQFKINGNSITPIIANRITIGNKSMIRYKNEKNIQITQKELRIPNIYLEKKLLYNTKNSHINPKLLSIKYIKNQITQTNVVRAKTPKSRQQILFKLKIGLKVNYS